MKNERPDQFMMIGLHKLAAQCGDGLVPELYELLSRRACLIEDNANVTEFPADQVRLPARTLFGLVLKPGDNILSFPSSGALRTPTKNQA